MSAACKFVSFPLAVLLTASLAVIVYARHANQEEFHNKITALTTELGTRQSGKEDLRRLMDEPRYQGLILRHDSANEWLVETPIEFGATNWVLYIKMIDSNVRELRVRTADSQNVHPKGAPGDISFLL